MRPESTKGKYIKRQNAIRRTREKTDWDPFHPLHLETDIIDMLNSVSGEDVIGIADLKNILADVEEKCKAGMCTDWKAEVESRLKNVVM